jgi:hypothetical protein
MIKPLQKPLLTLLLVFLAFTAFSQTGALPGGDGKIKPDDKSNDGTSSFKFGLSYQSNDVFMGRTDTVRTPMIVPEIKYTLKSGIYFSGTLDLLPNKKKKRLDGGDITAGYDFDITDDLSGGASFAKLFYSSSSTQIASAIRSTVNANFTYDIGDIVSPTISADYNLNKQGIGNDVFANLGITHDFTAESLFGDKDVLLVSPTATVNTGSQNFYDAYLTGKKIKAVNRTPAQNALLAAYINQLSKYTLLDYEISAPVEYKSGHFIFQFTPTYAIVKNQLPNEIQARISNQPSVFYFETGVFLKF